MQLAATTGQGAVAALMNPGGVRADLLAGATTFEEAFTTQPFGALLTTLSLTGAQLDCLLEQQFVVRRTLGPSASLTYVVTTSGTSSATDPCSGTKVSDVRINGVLVDPAASYRITVNSFLAGGGDGFSQLLLGTDRVNATGDDLTALVAHLEATSPLAPPATNRITVVP